MAEKREIGRWPMRMSVEAIGQRSSSQCCSLSPSRRIVETNTADSHLLARPSSLGSSLLFESPYLLVSSQILVLHVLSGSYSRALDVEVGLLPRSVASCGRTLMGVPFRRLEFFDRHEFSSFRNNLGAGVAD